MDAEGWLRLLLFVLAATFFVLMLIVSARFFQVEDRGARVGKRLMAALAGGGGLLVLWRIAELDPHLVRSTAAIPLFVYAIGMFLAAWHANKGKPLDFIGSARAPVHLNLNGPYKQVRHPFYSAYIASWIASALAAPEPFVVLIAGTLIALYSLAALREELRFLEGPLAAEYRDYKKAAGMFVPRLHKPSVTR